jgi:hypothetical protein
MRSPNIRDKRHHTSPRARLPLPPAAALRYAETERGRSSVVEHQLPKLSVVGSIPIARSNLRCVAASVGKPT